MAVSRRWAINGRFLTQKITGVQRYASEIVQALDRRIVAGDPLARGLDVELVVPAGTTASLELSAIRLRHVGPAHGPAASGHLWEQLTLPWELRGGLLSLGNSGPIRHREQIVCIHDLNTRRFPASYSLPFRLLQGIMVPLLGRSAARIATVSHHSADDLAYFGLCASSRIVVAPNGHEHALRWRARHSDATRAVAGPDTIVLVGSPAPHKNMALLLGLADRLAAEGLRIAIVGHVDPHVLRHDGLSRAAGNVHWLGRLPDEALTALLQESLCLAFPSFVEGFGLPPLEAMAVGCPVVTSDRASMPEVCGHAALYASPADPDAWLDRLGRLKRENGLRARLIAAGKRRAACFSWDESARVYMREMAAMDGVLEPDGQPAPSPHRAERTAPA
ncbi:glycosyltransferase family 4 protein [Ancylobacter oerskovii]|uniref:Glycosyltransferase family 4 protein n=1 Tax=Ancylobacter oerskovii TaxID=459519 RepID=A0ABW4Z072_9HYPH|nr:glycosyltransferase family 1 protein [Ancylobacter oerskovii]MBS7542946.1 glycosyltransferase family 4 protein [Ancylobacter oerskovii]